MSVEEVGNAVADVEDQPDGDETDDAVNVGLQEIADDVAIEQPHWLNFETRISKFETSTKSKIRMSETPARGAGVI